MQLLKGTMTVSYEDVQRLVNTLRSGFQERQVQAAMELRNLASEVVNKDVIRQAGGIQILLHLLDSGHTNILTTVCAETLACLAADDQDNREAIRAASGIRKLVGLLSAGPEADCTHRALLALRIVIDRESDRIAILKAGGVPKLVSLLTAGPDSEITEYAAAALGNLAAGGHALKDAIRGAGGIEPLVSLLREGPNEISAELAAVALRNMALQNTANKEAIMAAGGLQPLLELLSGGQERLVRPLQCEVVYKDLHFGGSLAGTQRFVASQCCFDPRRAELCIASRTAETSFISCFSKSAKRADPRDKSAERYSLLRKLTLTEPDAQTLELVLTVADMQGAPRVVEVGQKVPPRRLQCIIISPCAATEIKGAIMRMLTRTHLEKEFQLGKHYRPVALQGTSIWGSGPPLTPRISDRAIAT